jgi:hypothetical protein
VLANEALESTLAATLDARLASAAAARE